MKIESDLLSEGTRTSNGKEHTYTGSSPKKLEVYLAGTGSYLPGKILSNSEISTFVDTSDDWITTRTGIKERRIAVETETTSLMATKAAEKALANASVSALELDILIVATITPDQATPSTACHVQRLIGARNAVCFDLSAACSGFLYAMEVARQMIASSSYKSALVIAADKMSDVIDWKDRNTCVLFGDGAGAAVLKASSGKSRIMGISLGSDGTFATQVEIAGSLSSRLHAQEPTANRPALLMNGRETFKQAIHHMEKSIHRVLESTGTNIQDIGHIVPHQANIRILEALADRLGVDPEKFHINLDVYGNTSAASVIIALDESSQAGLFKKGDKILLSTFGAGIAYGGALIQWNE